MEPELIHMLATDLLNYETERDRQRLIGASEIGMPCNYCLVNRLKQGADSSGANSKGGSDLKAFTGNQHWLGAQIGTSIHATLEERARSNLDNSADYRYDVLQGAKIEESIVIGTLEGYGTIRSKPDLVLPAERQLIDWKSSTKAKINKFKTGGISHQYVVQQQLYAWGLNKSGVRIDECALVFIARDGSSEKDIFVHQFPYYELLAVQAWNRLEAAWEFVQLGQDPDVLPSSDECYHCMYNLRRYYVT